ncbi:MAG: 30S ribosomal protein S10 [Candidatus Nanoarchaeia archaeon]|nr:30S ribosomal protein S10 [Candidatus Haiyanarchaeum thermophilum]MCW1303087.1 30S ribosomal protein S10 [Candidatus Haiyanarchaeum thermophilum]MCW1303752.1 30S ribosomal protein S10 [Candidatus Haiyanarchaeum thermophilum]MCW1306633.1 30S ribosomal protein S10 [Candidatus Haiyanarchaeum thermophilum]MCW1307045.1 30S ribosomal protein S10 [Candidatus Haiyanarchaeum thermophilum]
MPRARIKLSSTNIEKLNEVCEQIKDIVKKIGADMRGPIPLPTKRLKVPVRTSPCGQGRELYETWELRIHKRTIDLNLNERALRLIMRIPVPKDVHMEIEITD